jgi:hypothetical protein
LRDIWVIEIVFGLTTLTILPMEEDVRDSSGAVWCPVVWMHLTS